MTYNSGVGLRTDDCKSNGEAEIGFVGTCALELRSMLGSMAGRTNREELKDNSLKIFDSYLKNGFTPAGFFKEFVNLNRGFEEPVHSIRRQSEGIYAMLHFLAYEKEHRDASTSGVGTAGQSRCLRCS